MAWFRREDWPRWCWRHRHLAEDTAARFTRLQLDMMAGGGLIATADLPETLCRPHAEIFSPRWNSAKVIEWKN